MSEDERLLISKWFPIAEVSVESVRERTAISALPPLYYLHVWFARRPLATSRAAILGSLLPTDVKRDDFLELLGIPSNVDVKKAEEKIVKAKASGFSLKDNPFFWTRAYKHVPSEEELSRFHASLEKSWNTPRPLLLDPMAGGGSIPFEVMRLGLPIIAGELNPVAYMCLKGTLEFPAKFGDRLIFAIKDFCNGIHEGACSELEGFFPQFEGETVYRYLWARTIRCSSCGLTFPLSPNWWILRPRRGSKGMAARILAANHQDQCRFEIISDPFSHGWNPDVGTVKGGQAECPRCHTVISGDEIKKEAQKGNMGHQLYAVSTKKKAAKNKTEWIFRTPTPEDREAVDRAEKKLREKLPVWESHGWVPYEEYSKGFSDRCSVYGIKRWSDLFNSRQLLTHLTYLEKFQLAKARLLTGKVPGTTEWDFATAVITYGAMVFDKCVDYNCLLSMWNVNRRMLAHAMSLQAFPFKWSYAETGHPRTLWPWALSKVIKALKGIIALLPKDCETPIVYCRTATQIPLKDKEAHCIVVDPPYAENVMYSEVSDFFYVWLKRLLGDIFPEPFKALLTDKEEEAVANPSRFKGAGRNAKKLAQ